jgi:hypothetical protein
MYVYCVVLQFEERGPYVYSEVEQKRDVEFLVPDVQFRIHRYHVFDHHATVEACPACTQNDTVSGFVVVDGHPTSAGRRNWL